MIIEILKQLVALSMQIYQEQNGWNTTTQYAYSPTIAWQSIDVDVQSEQTLTSNLFTPTGLSLLSFWHLYDFEGGFDGGLIELSTNNGASWQTISNNFLQNGYNTTIVASAPLANQQAYSEQYLHSKIQLLI